MQPSAHTASLQCCCNCRPMKRARMHVHARAVFEDLSVPQSREAMVKQAGASLAKRLGSAASSKRKKGFQKSSGTGTKLAIELALADESPESVVSVATEILEELDAGVRQKCILAFHDIQAALLASDRLDNEICSLEEFEPASPTGILLVVGVPPMSLQEESAVKLVKSWRGLAAVWLSFGTNSFTDSLSTAQSSLETTFAYEPVAVKGLIRTTDALIFRSMLEGKPSPWLLYKRDWGQYKLIGKTSNRPSATDLELAIYNSSAADSPITKGIKAFKAVTSRKSK